MVFYPPSWVPPLPQIPDDISIPDFILEARYRQLPLHQSLDPFTCGISGQSHSAVEVAHRVDALSRALAKEFDWQPNQGSEWDKVVAIFSFNAIDFTPLAWATHRLGGVCAPANAAYSTEELSYQLINCKAKALFTCLPLLSKALEAAAKAGIPRDRIYLLEQPEQFSDVAKAPSEFKTVSQFVQEGEPLPKLEKIRWGPGQGARTTAFLCYSSGTSGLPKGVMISHRNVIANSIQIATQESRYRRLAGERKPSSRVVLCLLPQSHIYCLVVLCHAAILRGDQSIVLPRFVLDQLLSAVQNFKIRDLYVVPPLIITLAQNKAICDKYDLRSVEMIFCGAAPLGAEITEQMLTYFPNWSIKQGYGLTESATVVCTTPHDDLWPGSAGVLLSGYEARILSPDGEEITGYDQPGELVVRSPSITTLGYLGNEKATKETFRDGWLHTGDEAVIRLSPRNSEHIFIVDRIKELIKVKGMQVAPAELEAHLLSHPAVADCAVVGTPHERSGEVPKAFVVKSPAANSHDDATTIRSIMEHVEHHKARHKWLKGGVEFINAIPKSPSGKILRRLLRDKQRAAARKAGVKL